MRLRVAPDAVRSSLRYPGLGRKPSFAVEAAAGEPVTLREGDPLRIEGCHSSLSVSMNDGTFAFCDGDGRNVASVIDVDGITEASYPMERHRSRVVLAAPKGEAYLGFGEKVGTLDKRGMRLTFWNTDCFPPEPHTDPLYASIPFFMALLDGVAWGLFLDEPARSRVDVAKSDAERLVWEVEGPELDLYFLAGPRPIDVLRRYYALTGRPFAPPLFALGAQQSRWGYESADEVLSIAEGYRRHGLALDVMYVDIDHLEGYKVFTWDRARFPDPARLVRELGEQGVKLVTIVDPGIKVEPGFLAYEQALENDYLVRLDRGGVLVGEVWPDPAVFPDFSRREVIDWWAGLHAPNIDSGVAGIWNDMNEPSCFSFAESRGIPAPDGSRSPGCSLPMGKTLPDEARHGTRRHLEVHNVYALGMAEAAFSAQEERAPEKRPFVLTRAAYAGIQRYAALWTGDVRSHASHLEASLPMLQGLAVSGVPFVGADVPGFIGDATGELLLRWTQAAVFTPLFRNHSAKGTERQEPWRFGPSWLEYVRRAYELRYRLLPALYTCMMERLLPPLRPLVFDHPDDAHALAAYDQFLFGHDLLVAPIVRPGATKRMVYLPAGAWLSLTPDLSGDGILEGGRHVIADAPLERVPMYLRGGGGLAVTEPALHTGGAEWASIDFHLHLADGAAKVVLYEDAGNGTGTGTWTFVAIAREGDHLRLSRRVEGPGHEHRRRERIILHGVLGADGSNGAQILEMPRDWTSLTVR